MKTVLMSAALLLVSGASALAQSGQRPAPVFPMPPPEPSVITTPGGRDVVTRSVTDRHTRCLHYGASIGVPGDKMEDYIKRCVLQ
jgi:hypothetical protein